MRFVWSGFVVWSMSRKPTVVAITDAIDWTAHGGFGSMRLNHAKKAGIAMYVRLAVSPPRRARYVASRFMARVGMKVLMRNSDIARGVVRSKYRGMVVEIIVRNRLMMSIWSVGLFLLVDWAR